MARATHEHQLLPPNNKTIQKAVRSCAGGKLQEFRIDGIRGLVLHVLPSGTATWYLHYDVSVGKKRRRRKFKLGRVDEIGLAQASAEVERLRPLIREGMDPAADKIDSRDAMTFAELAEDRLDKGDPLRPGTLRDYRHVLSKDILPIIGATPAQAVSREAVIDVLDRISARGANRRADTARAVISSIFGYGVDRGLVPANPATGLRNRHDYQPRDVIASDDDIRRLWSAIDRGESAMSSDIGTIVKLALLTGIRRTEIAGVRKAELNLDAAEPHLTIHRGRAKNRNAHRVPLSGQAADLFRGAIAKAGETEFVFPSERTASHIASRSVSKAMERSRVKLGIGDVAMHDLRRTLGTYMSRLGVPKDVRERILNHGGKRKGSITEGVYNRYEYDAEKRAALELWADAIDAIVGHGPTEIDGYHARLARLKGGEKIRVG